MPIIILLCGICKGGLMDRIPKTMAGGAAGVIGLLRSSTAFSTGRCGCEQRIVNGQAATGNASYGVVAGKLNPSCPDYRTVSVSRSTLPK